MATADRIIDLLHEAKAKPAGVERDKFLAEACRDDAALREQIVSLLKADAEEGDSDFLKINQLLRPTVPPSEKPGDRIGRYKLLEQIGEGGCGVVYMAEQEEPVRRRVALKVIKLGMDTKQVIARFEAERQALAMMDHPNIAKVFDAGSTERPLTRPADTLSPDGGEGRGEGDATLSSGRPFFVMELVRGIKITDYCDQNNLATKERLELFIQVCQAIQHAHQKGIIHRDIKPSNILVTQHDDVAVPKVIDFGIAKATIGNLTDKTVFTAFAQFIGTPAYMSPEQAQMSGLDIDTRADIYSLGVLLYELLTGHTPFDAKELLAAGLDEMRRKIREDEPAKPSTCLSTMQAMDLTTVARHRHAEPARLGTLLRGDLDWIVMKALEKDRSRRYETANGLATDIQHHLSNLPVGARPPTKLYRFQKLFRRNKMAVAAATAVVAALVIGLGLSTWQFMEKSKAEREQSRLREAAQEAQANEARLRHQAEAQELASRRRSYASDMNLVQQSLAANNLGRAQELLNRHRPQPGQQDLRGWEWRYLWQQCRSGALFTLCQKSNAISSLAVSFDGKWLAVGEHDQGGLSIWDLQTRHEVAQVTAGNGPVFAAFSPGELLLAFSVAYGLVQQFRKSVCLWNGATKQIVAELPLRGLCRGVAFSGDGQTLITSTCSEEVSGNEISLWRVRDGKKLASYAAEHDWQDDVPQLAVARDMSVAAHGTRDGHIHVVDLTTGKRRWRAESGGEHVISMAFSPDGKILASGAGFSESAIRLWDVASGKEIGRLEGYRGYVQTLDFTSDGKTLISAGSDQTIRLWDLATLTNRSLSRTLLGHKREVRRLALLPDSTLLASASQDGSVYIWDTAANQSARPHFTIPMPTNFTSFDRAWCFAPDGRSILAVDRRGRVVQWQGLEFQEMVPLLELGTRIHGARISDDGQLIAAGSTDGIVRVWDLPSQRLLHEFTVSSGPADPLQFLAQDRRLLIHCPSTEDVHEWDLMARREIRSWQVGRLSGYAWIASSSPDGRWFAMADAIGHASLRDLQGNPVRTQRLDIMEAAGADISPDGKLIAIASYAGFARVWETETLREVSTFRDFLQGVKSVAFSRDSKRLVTGSDGREAIKLWDMESHEAVLTLEAQGSQFFSTVFSADGNLIGAANSRRAVNVWRAPSWTAINATEKAQKADP